MAFAPMLALPGTMGKVFKVIPLIVIPTLLLSLVECLFILPAHLSHLKHRKKKHIWIVEIWNRFQTFFDKVLAGFIRRVYRPSLDLALSWRYATMGLALATLLLAVGYVAGGRIKFEIDEQGKCTFDQLFLRDLK